MIAAQIIIAVALVFTATGLSCAVWIGRRRPPAADPFSNPFGEMPGFTAEQLRLLTPRWDPEDPLRRSFAVRDRLKRDSQALFRIRQTNSAGLAIRPDAGGVGIPSPRPLRPDVARKFLIWWHRHG